MAPEDPHGMRRIDTMTNDSKLRAPRCPRAAALVLLLFAGCALRSNAADPPADAKPTPSSAAEKSAAPKLSGRVVLKRTVPKRRIVNMSKDPKCIQLHNGEPVLDEDLIVGAGGGIKNVFVYVRRDAPEGEYPLPDKPAVLDQKGCMYHPRVQGVRVGQKILVGNGDPVTHNVRSFPVVNRAFNFGQPPDTEPRERVFERAEREIEVQCDFHPWMHAYIFVMDHPFFAVTADDGAYAIPGLPPGEYTLAVWHEKLGRKQQTVTVGKDGSATVDFAY
jgi:Carboxypeptidase regulatory-like domain